MQRTLLQLSGSRLDHSRPFKMHPIHAKNHITNEKQKLVQKLPEILNPAGQDAFHRLELFGGMFSAAGTV